MACSYISMCMFRAAALSWSAQSRGYTRSVMALRPGESWRRLAVVATIPVIVLTCLLLWLAQSAPASPAVQPVDPCLLSTPGVVPPNDKPPVAVLRAPAKATVGQAVAFDGSGSYSATATVTSWCWTFGDGSHAFGAKVSHTYTKPGTESVALTVTDPYGLFGRASSTIKVSPAVNFRLTIKESAHDAANRLHSGEHVRLYGSLTPARSGQVAIERSRSGGRFSRVRVVKLHTRHGVASFSITIPFVHNGSYRARVLGTKITSRGVKLRLRPTPAPAK
jgi:PKD domain